jgi:Domain of unknown function (DUF4202)
MTRRFDHAIAAIDAANAEDPTRIADGGTERPAEFVYGERMSAALARYRPNAPEALKLAVRAQHIERWMIPRASYPMDRAGYHLWRNTLKTRHAERAGEILKASGYAPDEIARVQSLIQKQNLKQDADAQTLEDVVCLVFLEFYAEAFAARHDRDKVVDILRKSFRKMSPEGRDAAARLPVSSTVQELVGHAGAGGA